MISEISVSPRASNNKARHLFFALLISAVAVSALYIAIPLYKGLVGVLAIILLTAAIFIYNKYMATRWHYEVMISDSGTPLFIVSATQGRRRTAMCRIALATIQSIEPETRAERRARKTAQGVMKYNYLPTLDPEKTYLISSSSRYERAEIRLEASEEFVNLLLTYADEARLTESE